MSKKRESSVKVGFVFVSLDKEEKLLMLPLKSTAVMNIVMNVGFIMFLWFMMLRILLEIWLGGKLFYLGGGLPSPDFSACNSESVYER